MEQCFAMDQSGIQAILPHRYPFLLVDRITEFVPGAPLVPCSILLEMTTQLGAVLVLERPDMAGKLAVILQIPAAQMHAAVQPGDAVRAEVQILKWRGNFGELRGTVHRGPVLVAEGCMRFAAAPAQELISGRTAIRASG